MFSRERIMKARKVLLSIRKTGGVQPMDLASKLRRHWSCPYRSFATCRSAQQTQTRVAILDVENRSKQDQEEEKVQELEFVRRNPLLR